MSLVEILYAFIKGQLRPGQVIVDKKGIKLEVLSKDLLQVSAGEFDLILSLPLSSKS